MLVDNEQWHAEIGNFNGCLHVKECLHLFDYQIINKLGHYHGKSKPSACYYTSNNISIHLENQHCFLFLNIIFVFVLLFVTLQFTTFS